MIRAFMGLLGAGMMLAGAAHAQTYQVGQYLGNMNDLNRFTYNTMGSAAQHANYGPGGANWTTLNGQNAARMAGTATATIGGRTVPLTLISRVPVPAIVNGMRAVASMNPTVAAVTLLGAFAMDHWLEQSKLDWNRDPTTNITYPFVILKESPQCNMASVNQAAYAQWIAGEQSPPGTQCPRSVNALTIQGPATTKNGVSIPSGQCAVGAQWTSFTSSNGSCVPLYTDGFADYQRVPAALVPSEREPATWDQVQPLLESGNYDAVDWKGITEQLLRKGGSIDPSQVTSTVSGPSTQPGEKTTTTGKNAAGQPTTTTKQTTHNYTYNNNNVTHNTTTTTTTVNNITNQIENETTEETENKPDESATDSPLPEVPDLYERKYPDGLKGVWDTKSAAIMQSPLFSLASGMVPTIGDGGCPQWSLPVDIGIIDFGVYDISLPCNVWAFVRIVILITALFLVRRLIFGG